MLFRSRLAKKAFKALMLVPEAVAKPSQPVEVTLASVPFVAMKLVAKRLVLVVLVPVALVQVRFVKLDGVAPVTVRFWILSIVLMYVIHELQLRQERLVLDTELHVDDTVISNLQSR